MKLKFVLVPLVVLGFNIGCSSTKEVSKNNIGNKWISPSKSICIANGGRIKNGVCTANWSTAKDICSASSGRLPSIYEFKKVIVDCGGTIDDGKNNAENSVYQDCYKRKGFSDSGYYWSSTTYASDTNRAWLVYFYGGSTYHFGKSTNYDVRCVRAGQ